MAVLNIVKDGDELLRKTSRPVTEITPRIIRLLDDMKDTLHKANGVGLAAPQVGVLRRIAIIDCEPGELKATDRHGNTFTVEGEGLLARALCHETDHLDGVIFYDKAVRMLTKDEIEND